MSAAFSLRHPELVSGSIWPLGQRRQAKPDGEILPMPILAFEQIDLPLAVPALELLFASDGGDHVVEHFEMDEAMNFISLREAGNDVVAVLPEPRDEIGCDAEIQRSVVTVREEIDARIALELHATGNADGWMLNKFSMTSGWNDG